MFHLTWMEKTRTEMSLRCKGYILGHICRISIYHEHVCNPSNWPVLDYKQTTTTTNQKKPHLIQISRVRWSNHFTHLEKEKYLKPLFLCTWAVLRILLSRNNISDVAVFNPFLKLSPLELCCTHSGRKKYY